MASKLPLATTREAIALLGEGRVSVDLRKICPTEGEPNFVVTGEPDSVRLGV
jgi:hypothetical protein